MKQHNTCIQYELYADFNPKIHDFRTKNGIYLGKKCHTILRIHNFDKIEGGKVQIFAISKQKIMLKYCMQFFDKLRSQINTKFWL